MKAMLFVLAAILALAAAQPSLPVLPSSFYANITVAVVKPQQITVVAEWYYDYTQSASRIEADVPGFPAATIIARHDLKKAFVVVLTRCLISRDLSAPQLPPDVLQRAESAKYIGVETIGGRQVDHWQVLDGAAEGIPVDFWFIQNTNEPFRIEVNSADVVVAIQFTTFRAQANSPTLFTQPRNCPASLGNLIHSNEIAGHTPFLNNLFKTPFAL